jgi:hypothetical protein
MTPCDFPPTHVGVSQLGGTGLKPKALILNECVLRGTPHRCSGGNREGLLHRQNGGFPLTASSIEGEEVTSIAKLCSPALGGWGDEKTWSVLEMLEMLERWEEWRWSLAGRTYNGRQCSISSA